METPESKITNENIRDELLNLWEKIVIEWEKDPDSISNFGIGRCLYLFRQPSLRNTDIVARRILALFKPSEKIGNAYWFPPGECREERATIAAFCWALTKLGDIEAFCWSLIESGDSEQQD